MPVKHKRKHVENRKSFWKITCINHERKGERKIKRERGRRKRRRARGNAIYVCHAVEQCSLLDMLEVLRAPRPPWSLQPLSARIPCLHCHGGPWRMPFLAPPLPPGQVLWKIVCLFPCFHFSSFVFFLLFFFLFLLPISLPVYLHSRSFCFVSFFLVPDTTLALALATAPAPAQLALSSWVAPGGLPGPRPRPTPTSRLSCVLFYLHLFIND